MDVDMSPKLMTSPWILIRVLLLAGPGRWTSADDVEGKTLFIITDTSK